jgi:GrpB-like predicted nucleotidyltransferase (UPF0157 family)
MTVTLVEKYNPEWPRWFREIKEYLGKKIAGACLRIEHVGSTSVPGMTAKPIIDLILVIEPERWQEMKSLLEGRGYFHEGDKGLKGREAFDLADKAAGESLPAHHLYVCPEHNAELRKETAFCDYLKNHKVDAERLSALKWELAERFNNDKYPYMDGKDAMCKEITVKALEYFAEKRKKP